MTRGWTRATLGIGTGLTATPAIAQSVHAYIRSWIRARFGVEAAATVRIQYGGSVKPDSVDELMQCPDVDGCLVGGASLSADAFSRIFGRGGLIVASSTRRPSYSSSPGRDGIMKKRDKRKRCFAAAGVITISTRLRRAILRAPRRRLRGEAYTRQTRKTSQGEAAAAYCK